MNRKIFTFTFLLAFSLLAANCSKKHYIVSDKGTIEWTSPDRSGYSDITASSSGVFNDLNKISENQPANKFKISETPHKQVQIFPNEAKTIEKKSELKPQISKLSRSEIKALKKELRKNQESGDENTNTLLLVLIAILLPPVAVGLARGWASFAFILNIILTVIFWVPGVIHALIVVLTRRTI